MFFFYRYLLGGGLRSDVGFLSVFAWGAILLMLAWYSLGGRMP